MAGQQAIDRGSRYGVSHRSFIGGLDPTDFQNSTGGGLFQKGTQQLVFLRHSQILVTPTSSTHADQRCLPSSSEPGLEATYRVGGPSNRGGDLVIRQVQGNSQPHALDSLELRFGFGLPHSGSQCLGSPIRQRSARRHAVLLVKEKPRGQYIKYIYECNLV
jgi:hypothetical protein